MSIIIILVCYFFVLAPVTLPPLISHFFSHYLLPSLLSPFTDYEGIDGLFFAGTSGRLLIKSEDRVVLYDKQARKVIAELQVREGSRAQHRSMQFNY